MIKVAALFVQPDGVYANRPDVDAWPESRDARQYAGPWPVVAHPPCARWGRFAHRGEVGADGGCFVSALRSVQQWGGVIEHPEGSAAWKHFDLPRPRFGVGWIGSASAGWSCSVDQGRYGHPTRKRTWLYYRGQRPPADLDWAPGTKTPRPGEPFAYIAADDWVRGLRARGVLVHSLSRGQRAATPERFAQELLCLAQHSKGSNWEVA